MSLSFIEAPLENEVLGCVVHADEHDDDHEPAEELVHMTFIDVLVNGAPEDTIRGVISELSPAISSETRTFKGKILIQNEGLKLRPGMFVKADIVVNKADSAIIIPKSVIQSNRRIKYVYIVEKNTALLRELKTGLEDDKNIQVLEGLKENDNLVVKGFETLKENAKVKVQK